MIYRISVFNLVHRIPFWVIVAILFFVNLFTMFIIPTAILPNLGILDYYNSVTWIEVVIPTLFVSIGIFSNITTYFANSQNDMIYQLTSDTTRPKFYFSKLAVVTTFVFPFVLILFLLIIIIAFSLKKPEQMFTHGCDPIGLFFGLILIASFCTILSVTLDICSSRTGLYSVILIALLFLYCAIFPMFWPFLENGNINYLRVKLFCSIIPNAIFGSLSIIGGGLGLLWFVKKDVK